MMSHSGSASRTCRQSMALENSPFSHSKRRPLAASTSSGPQLPIANSGSIHSSATRLGARRCLTAPLDDADAAFHRAHQICRVPFAAQRLADREDAVKNSLHVASPKRQYLPRRNTSGPPDIRRRDRAHLTVLLGNQQVGLQGIDQLRVDVIERLARRQPAAHFRVDLRRSTSRRRKPAAYMAAVRLPMEGCRIRATGRQGTRPRPGRKQSRCRWLAKKRRACDLPALHQQRRKRAGTFRALRGPLCMATGISASLDHDSHTPRAKP